MYKAIYFDMDGTIADLYTVEGWLEQLKSSNPAPYENARPLVRLSSLAKRLNNLQRKGYKVGIVSWGSKASTKKYLEAVTEAKLKWLEKHMPSVRFDEVKVVPYGTPKGSCVRHPSGILFDDEERNRKEWKGFAFPEKSIEMVLENLK